MKLKIIICNFIYLLISAAVIVSYAVFPLVSVKVDMNITASALEKMLGDQEEFKDVDMNEVAGDGIPLKIEIKTTSLDVLEAIVTKDSETYVKETVIGKNVDKTVTAIEPALNRVVSGVAKSVAKTETKNQVKSSLNDYLLPGEDAQEYMDKAGLDDEYFSAAADEFYDAFTEDGATVDSLSEVVANKVNDAIDKLYESDPLKFAALKLAGVDKETIKSELNENLDKYGLVDENGNISDVSKVLAKLLKSALSDGNKDGNQDKTAKASKNVFGTASAAQVRQKDTALYDYSGECIGKATPYDGETTGGGSVETGETDGSGNTEEDLAETLKGIIYEKIPESVIPAVALAFKISAYACAVILCIWVLFAVLLAFKSFSDYPGLPVHLIFAITGAVQFAMGLGFTILAFAPKILNKIPQVAEAMNIFGTLKIAAFSSTIIAMIAFIFMFFFGFYYKHLKNEYKGRMKEPVRS